MLTYEKEKCRYKTDKSAFAGIQNY